MELTEEQKQLLKNLQKQFEGELEPIPENGGLYQGMIISAAYAKELDKAIQERLSNDKQHETKS